MLEEDQKQILGNYHSLLGNQNQNTESKIIALFRTPLSTARSLLKTFIYQDNGEF